MSGRIIYVIISIIYLVYYNQVFLEALDAPIAIETCVLTYTSDFFLSIRTIPALV